MFKSAIAAKQAYTRAENAWEAVRGLANDLTWERRRKLQDSGGSMDCAEYEAYDRRIAQTQMEAEAKRVACKAVYDTATAQGHFVKSYHFGHNPTRDLVLQNID